ncbi:unnamed protein product [Gordionus sp. m RMFG-2023]
MGIKKLKFEEFQWCFLCQSYGHLIKNCNIPIHILQIQEREEHLSEIDETPRTSYFCGKNNRIKPEVAYRNYNKINEIESRHIKYGNGQWPPTKYDGTLEKIKEIRDKTVGVTNTSMGHKFKYYGKMLAPKEKDTKLGSTIVKVMNSTNCQEKYNGMETEDEEILKDK